MRIRKAVVIDTNLFISAIIHPDRICAEGIKIAAAHFQIVVSAETKGELIEVPKGSYLDPYASYEDRMLRCAAYLDILKLVPITKVVTDCRDPKDNMFLSTALSANACVLVSGDKRDLIKMHPYQGLSIIKMRDFVEGYRTYLNS
jgi:putative PIN family toxin of toxin-antitoxin system